MARPGCGLRRRRERTQPHHRPFCGAIAELSQATSGCSVCCPYRASLLTGQYPLTHGVFVNDTELAPDSYSIARAFNDAGYNTGYIGKWHVYGSPDGKYGRREAYVPRDYQMGFDYWKGFECTHDYNDSWYFFNDDPTPRRWEGYDAFPQSEDAATYIAEHAGGDNPYMLMLSWGPPHFPLHTAPEEYKKRFDNQELVLRPNVPEHLREKAQKEMRGYYAHVAAMDDAFKIVWDAVEASGEAENTIFILSADHGDMRQSQGLDTKLFPWEESVRVPFLLHWPQLEGSAGQECPVPIDAPDIMPTLLGLCGLEVPDSVDGRDWSPIIRGEEALAGDEAALLNMPAEFTELRRNDMRAYRGLRSATHTYVRNTDGPWLLYDNVVDPYQMTNLIGLPEHSERQATMESRLQTRLAALGDEFLDSQAYIDRFGYGHYLEVNSPIGTTWVDPWAKTDSA